MSAASRRNWFNRLFGTNSAPGSCYIAGVIEGLPQFCQTILQIVHCFFGVIGFVELPVQRMRDTDLPLTSLVRVQNQLFLPAAQFNVYRHPTFAGGFCQCLLPVMIKITV